MATLRWVPRWWGLQLLVFALALGGGAPDARAETKSAPAAKAPAAKATPAAPGAEAAPAADEAAPAVDEAALAEAKLHFENGNQLVQANPPNYQDAHQQYLLAYEKSGQRWTILGNLAFCALNLERDGEALTYYEKYLEQGGDQIEAAERASIERELLLVKGNLATVELSSREPGTRVSVRREGSSAPAQLYALGPEATKLGLRAGQLQITATAGEKTETWSVVLAAGDSKSYAFEFAPPAPEAAPAAAPVAAEPEADRRPSPLRTAGFITGGVGIAALIGGIVTGVMTMQMESDARAQCIGTICPEDAEADFQAASDLAMVTNVLFIGGGVLTATGVTLVIVGGKQASAESARSLRLTPHVSPIFAGLSAQGTF